MMKNLAAIGLSTMLFLGVTSRSVHANQPIIVRVDSPLSYVMNINIHPGVGTNINFESLGETIETMFLDNKSFIGLTTNGCMTDRCPNSNASLVHLSLIDKLDIPGVIRVNKQTAQSGLTIVTKDKFGRRKTYIFNLRYAKKSDPAVALVDFIPQLYNAPDFKRIDANIQQRKEVVVKLKSGLSIAIARGDFRSYSGSQVDAINKMLNAIYDGRPLMESAHKYAIDTELVTKLILLGS
jgi:hypothetical protein